MKAKNIILIIFLLCFSATSISYSLIKDQNWGAFPVMLYGPDTGYASGFKYVHKDFLKEKRILDAFLLLSEKGETASFMYLTPFKQKYYFKYNLAYINFKQIYFEPKTLDESDYHLRRISQRVTLGYSLNKDWSIYLRLRDSDISIRDWNYINKPILNEKEFNGGGIKSFALGIAHDTRDNVIEPSEGGLEEISLEKSSDIFGSNYTFTKYSFDLRHYHQIKKGHVVAFRLLGESVEGDAPFFEKPGIGGVMILRGLRAGRFFDNTMLSLATEYRFPLFWVINGVVFTEVGRVWNKPAYINLKDYKVSSGCGLRFSIVPKVLLLRLDVGFSAKSMGIYFDFGHVF